VQRLGNSFLGTGNRLHTLVIDYQKGNPLKETFWLCVAIMGRIVLLPVVRFLVKESTLSLLFLVDHDGSAVDPWSRCDGVPRGCLGDPRRQWEVPISWYNSTHCYLISTSGETLEGQRIVTTLHHSRRLLRLGVHTFCGWVYLVQTARFTLLIFGWVDLLYRNFDDCIYCGWSHHSCYFCSACHCVILQIPYFGQF